MTSNALDPKVAAVLKSALGQDWSSLLKQRGEPSDLRPVVERARTKMDALLALDRNPRRAELAAAGVPQHRINTLYPLEFADLIPGVIEFVTPEKYVVRGRANGWPELSAYPKNIIDDWASIREITEQASDEIFISDAFAALCVHLEACLPKDVSEAEKQARAMASALWYAYWGMLKLEKTAMRRSMCKAFDSTINWVLPNFS